MIVSLRIEVLKHDGPRPKKKVCAQPVHAKNLRTAVRGADMGITQVEAITAKFSLAARRASTALAEMLGSDVEMSLMGTTQMATDEAHDRLDRLVTCDTAAYLQAFHGEYAGFAALILPPEGASGLTSRIIRGTAGCPEPGVMCGNAFGEIGSILFGSILPILATSAPEAPIYDLPIVVGRSHLPLSRALEHNNEQVVLCSVVRFSSKDFRMNGEFLLGICPQTVETLLASTVGRCEENR